MGSIVVGLERRAIGRLGVTKFFKGGADGEFMFSYDVDIAGVKFVGRGHNILMVCYRTSRALLMQSLLIQPS